MKGYNILCQKGIGGQIVRKGIESLILTEFVVE